MRKFTKNRAYLITSTSIKRFATGRITDYLKLKQTAICHKDMNKKNNKIFTNFIIVSFINHIFSSFI